jgi:hypothetical protein
MPRDIIGDRIRIGVNPAPQSNPATTRTSIALILHDDAAGNPDNAAFGQFSTDGNGASNIFIKGRGTVAVPLTVVDGDRISDLVNLTFSGGTLFDSARFRCYVDGPVTAGQAPPGRFEWETSVGNAVPVIRMALNRLGVLSLGNGAPAVAGANFGGLQIGTGAPASGIYLGNSPNAAANVLDNYHESTSGEYLPALTFGGVGTGITYSNRFGWFTRIGNRIFANFSISLSSKGAATGVAEISLPVLYDSGREIASGGMVNLSLNMVALTSQIVMRTNGAATGLMRFNNITATGSLDLNNTNFTNTTVLYGQMVYDAVS